MKKVLIIGKKSLLSSNIEKYLKREHFVKRISFFKISKNKRFLLDFDFVINCSFDIKIKDYRKTSDYILASLLNNKKIIFVMISTCKVYASNKKKKFSEKMKCKPYTSYGKLKFLIEKKVKKILKNRVLILRVSNIIQFDLRKKTILRTFINTMLSDLKNNQKIFIPIKNFKKDFIPIKFFNDALNQLLKMNTTGTYNIGTGIGLKLEEFAKLLIKGFGYGKIYKVNDCTDNIILNINKLKRKIIYHVSKKKIENEIIRLGAQLSLYE
jgi:dTDP-4-dehydrorhamnose reductase